MAFVFLLALLKLILDIGTENRDPRIAFTFPSYGDDPRMLSQKETPQALGAEEAPGPPAEVEINRQV
jgi:hypothetical protein